MVLLEGKREGAKWTDLKWDKSICLWIYENWIPYITGQARNPNKKYRFPCDSESKTGRRRNPDILPPPPNFNSFYSCSIFDLANLCSAKRTTLISLTLFACLPLPILWYISYRIYERNLLPHTHLSPYR